MSSQGGLRPNQPRSRARKNTPQSRQRQSSQRHVHKRVSPQYSSAYAPIGPKDDENPYVDNIGNTETDANGLRKGVGAIGTIVAVLTFMLIGLAVGYALWIHHVQSDVGKLQKIIITDPHVPFLDVYIDPVNGDDVHGKGTEKYPFQTLDRAFERVAECTGTRATIHVMGDTCGSAGALDLGTDPQLDFFPLTSRYAEIVIRGGRIGTIDDTVASVSTLPGAQDYVQLTTSGAGPLHTPTFVHQTADNRIFTLQDNTATTLNVVGGNVEDASVATGLSNPIAFAPGNPITSYDICNQVTWTGILRLNHSYSRVCFEDLEIVPQTATSAWVNPPLRDDAVVFRGSRLVAKSTNADQGTFRGSMTLEGVVIRGDSDTPAATTHVFNSPRDNVCARMQSVRAERVTMAFVDTCSAFFVSLANVTAPQAITIQSGEFRGHGLVLQNNVPVPSANTAIRIQSGSSVYLTHVHVVGQFARALNVVGTSQGHVQDFVADVTDSPVPSFPVVEVSFASTYAFENVAWTGDACLVAGRASHVHMGQSVTCTPLDGNAFRIEDQSSLNFAPTSSSVIVQSKLVPIVLLQASTLTLDANLDNFDWTMVESRIPLIRAVMGSSIFHPNIGTLVNGNPANKDYILQIGANNPTPFWSQDDYIHLETQRCQAQAGNPPANPEVWVSVGFGNDMHAGSQQDPVQTLEQAIAILGQRSGSSLQCSIVIAGTVDIGTDPHVCTSPAHKVCKHITIRGIETNKVDDVVDLVLVVDPADRNWMRILATTGGYTPSFYQRRFVRNNVQNRVFVVDDNAANTIDTIAGVGNAFSHLPNPPMPIDDTPWSNGDSYTLFTLGSTLRWTGALTLDTGDRVLDFASINLMPLTVNSYMRVLDGPQHHVAFRGCTLHVMADDFEVPGYQGSMLFQGVFVKGMTANAVFTGQQNGRCILADSMWVESALPTFSGSCGVQSFKSSLSDDQGILINRADFLGYNLFIENSQRDLFRVDHVSNARVEGMAIVKDAGNTATTIWIDDESSASLYNINAMCGNTTCFMAMYAGKGTQVHLANSVILNGRMPMVLDTRANVDVSGTLTLSGAYGAAPIQTKGQSLFLDLVDSTVNAPITFPVVDVQPGAGTVVFRGNASAYAWSTTLNTPLVRVQDGAHAINQLTGGNFMNTGPNSAHVLTCGSHPIDPWDVSDRDDNANIQCTRTGFPKPDTLPSCTVYVNEATGSDDNRGTVDTEPLETLERALDVISLCVADECIIRIKDNLNLGDSPNFCFKQVLDGCKRLRIVGDETELVATDTVASINPLDPEGRNWQQIVGTTGGYPSVSMKYVRNINRDRVYMIESGTASTLDLVGGDWSNGDTFEVYGLQHRISWTGNLQLDIVQGGLVEWESLIFRANNDASYLTAPLRTASVGNGASVLFKGCQLDTRDTVASYRGSIDFEGVLSLDIPLDAVFTQHEPNRRIHAQSVIIEGATVSFTGHADVSWLKLDQSPATALDIADASMFRGRGIYITAPNQYAMRVRGASQAHLENIHIVSTDSFADTAVHIEESASTHMTGVYVACGNTCVRGIVYAGASGTLGPVVTVTSAEPLVAELGAQVSVLATNLTLEDYTSPPIQILSSASLQMKPTTLLSLNASISNTTIFYVDAATLTLLGNATLHYDLTTLAPMPLIQTVNGGVAQGRFTDTLLNGNGAGGPPGSEVLTCGGNGLSDWLVSENDFGLATGTTQGCNCPR